MLKPLPSEPFPFVKWKTVRVNIERQASTWTRIYSEVGENPCS
jgi:hypothetical protein